VCVRVTSSGQQTGEFMGLPPSGKRYTISEIHIFRIRDGQVSEHWHELNAADLMRQLGAGPQDRRGS
jgi:predicted ester cyclase